MIDDQKVVYERILEATRQSVNDQKKRVVIVKGGPGTGKSVLAINLLSKLTNEDMVVQYVTKSETPRYVYRKKLKGTITMSNVDNLFKGSASYVHTECNKYDVLLADEAHRLMKRSQYTKIETGKENQIREIIHSAKCSVFFIDEKQRVTLSDIGSIKLIKQFALEENAEVIETELKSQFRCNGSDGYLAWVEHVLEIRNTANFTMTGIDYDIQIMDSPEEVRDLIYEKNKHSNKARILAGYCWEWEKDHKDNPDYADIVIGDFKMSWNLGNTKTWAIDEKSVSQVGCVHTSQGLEFDYVGVIIGEDMVYRNGHIVTDYTKRASTDKTINGIVSMAKKDPKRAQKVTEEIIKNTYRTLMTRGMKGCYVYCCDRELAEYLRSCIG